MKPACIYENIPFEFLLIFLFEKKKVHENQGMTVKHWLAIQSVQRHFEGIEVIHPSIVGLPVKHTVQGGTIVLP